VWWFANNRTSGKENAKKGDARKKTSFWFAKKKGFGEREEGRDKGEWGRVWVE